MTEIVIEHKGEVVAPKPKARKRNGDGRDVVKAEPAPVPAQAVPGGPSLLAILQAVMTDPTASVERLHSAFDFYQRIEAVNARKAFDAAMAAAKADFQQITKKHVVSRGGAGGTFKHEDLADIAAAVDPALSANGLSYRFRATSNVGEPISVTCVVTHRDGHFEETTLSAGADPSGGKNTIQAIGSTLSYLQRYSLRLALGIAAGREDDGSSASETPKDLITDAQCQMLLDKIATTQSDTERFCNYFKIEGVARLPASQFNRALGLLNQKGRAA